MSMTLDKKLAIIPRASVTSFKGRVKRSIADKHIMVVKKAVGKREIQRILDTDARRMVKSGNTLRSFLETNKVARYNGSVGEFAGMLKGRKTLDFLMVTYMGKMYNNLKSDFKNPDLSNLVFVNRVNAFARKLHELTGKKVQVTIATENGLFDRDVLRIKRPLYRKQLAQLQKLMDDFGIEYVRLRPLDEFVGSRYQGAFRRSVSRLNKDRGALPASADFRPVFETFYSSYPSDTFREAVGNYTDSKTQERIEKWTLDALVRYMSFHAARSETDFWGINKGYIRCSVSNRKGVLVFEYGVGRMSPLHGMAVYRKNGVFTEHFYDVVNALPEGKPLTVWIYKDMPVCIVE